jgi:hypothetical protein
MSIGEIERTQAHHGKRDAYISVMIFDTLLGGCYNSINQSASKVRLRTSRGVAMTGVTEYLRQFSELCTQDNRFYIRRDQQ